MRLLIDTNVFLEIILDQQRAEEAKELLAKIGDHEFFISDYSLHSIGLLLFRRRQHDVFQKFLQDVTIGLGVTLMSVPLEAMDSLADAAKRFRLDFDDAYQYATAEKNNLTLVSFDTDFDRTPKGKKTPSDIIER
jgi:predicted nucleic acid-binding protein